MGDPERLGILGGTFDPPHAGHLALARAARKAAALDRVLLVVAGDPWQKRGEVTAAAADRLAMTEALAAGEEGVEVSDVEVRRAGPSYTVDTLEALARPGRRLVLVLGDDVAARLSTWHRSERVRELAELLVASRPGGDPAAASEVVDALRRDGWIVQAMADRLVDASSTGIRARLATGDPVDGLVPDSVLRVIRDRGLYTPPQ
ncbi:MAG TPA: nicotinate-nucleotide adenylyltransferase [Acidimicrobiia bacterium]|nr:nicotinate-nucleotide adenylyltransferase [Acidimicrobiia bacterium]